MKKCRRVELMDDFPSIILFAVGRNVESMHGSNFSICCQIFNFRLPTFIFFFSLPSFISHSPIIFDLQHVQYTRTIQSTALINALIGSHIQPVMYHVSCGHHVMPMCALCNRPQLRYWHLRRKAAFDDFDLQLTNSVMTTLHSK